MFALCPECMEDDWVMQRETVLVVQQLMLGGHYDCLFRDYKNMTVFVTKHTFWAMFRKLSLKILDFF
jgi:hypothetical protein